jgi:hypothetical protein
MAIFRVLLQVGFFAVSVSDSIMLLPSHRYFYLLLFLHPVLLVLLDEYLFRKAGVLFAQRQRILKLEFETRLGRYSPK